MRNAGARCGAIFIYFPSLGLGPIATNIPQDSRCFLTQMQRRQGLRKPDFMAPLFSLVVIRICLKFDMVWFSKGQTWSNCLSYSKQSPVGTFQCHTPKWSKMIVCTRPQLKFFNVFVIFCYFSFLYTVYFSVAPGTTVPHWACHPHIRPASWLCRVSIRCSAVAPEGPNGNWQDISLSFGDPSDFGVLLVICKYGRQFFDTIGQSVGL